MRLEMRNFKATGFSLMELIVTASIIAILAVVGIPAYTKYRIRSKVSYMYNSASAAKLIVTGEYFNNSYSFADSDYASGSAPFVTPQNSIVSSIAITNGVITVTGNSNELGGRSIIMVFTPTASNNEITWSCAIGSAFLSFAPQNCQNAL